MNAAHDEYLELCAGWAVGSLDPADQARLEEHLARGCLECEAALAEFASATVLLAASAGGEAPPASLRARVLARAAVEPAGRDRTVAGGPAGGGQVVALRVPPRGSWWPGVAAAAAVILAVTTTLLWTQARRLDRQVAAQRERIARLERSLADDRSWNEVLSSAHARVSVLEPTTQGDPRLRARATYDPATRRAVVVFDNLVPPTGRDYQLWVIRDGAPASLGVIQPDADGRAILRLENVGETASLSAFAVSLEPDGGSPNPAAPSGPVVMLGPLGG